MSQDSLNEISDFYDIIVIGGGLGGLTSANYLAKLGHSVLLLEHHYKFGGLATWFKRKGGHIFDISLHGFPVGMKKSCRKYWSADITDSIHQLESVRFVNPQFNINTTFERNDFTRILNETFKVPYPQIESFFEHLRQMNYYDRDDRTTGELFEEFFPGRNDVHRLLMEPIAYANGSTMQDPAITYGIVFSNFMSKGVFIFRGGTDTLINQMVKEMKSNGVDMRTRCLVEEILTENVNGKETVRGVRVNGKEVYCNAVISNSNIKNTVFKLLGKEKLPTDFAQEAQKVRINSSSCQVYMGVKEGETIPNIGDLIFTSKAKEFCSKELTDMHTQSRTFSMYYPDMRAHTKTPRYTVVCSLNAKWDDWAHLSEEDYQIQKDRICQESLAHLEDFIPNVSNKIDWIEAGTPRTINRYTRHWDGTSFGTKFEGLKISMELPENVSGLYHAGSVGIIMSGWLGSMNYGVITASKVDPYVRSQPKPNTMNIQQPTFTA